MVDFNEKLFQDGWAVVDLPNQEYLQDVHSQFEGYLRDITGSKYLTLEDYHSIADNDETHIGYQQLCFEFSKNREFSSEIVRRNLDLFTAMLGPDLCKSTHTNLRMVRPGKNQDNIDLHRDIDVGHTTFEINVWLPLVEVDAGSALQVASGSHLLARRDLQMKKFRHATIKEGSPKHRLGYLHSPFSLENSANLEHMTPVPMTKGQILISSTSILHGQMINSSNHTRWSMDFVIANAMAPIDWGYHGNEQKFEVISQSAVSRVSRAFSKSSAEEFFKNREVPTP